MLPSQTSVVKLQWVCFVALNDAFLFECYDMLKAHYWFSVCLVTGFCLGRVNTPSRCNVITIWHGWSTLYIHMHFIHQKVAQPVAQYDSIIQAVFLFFIPFSQLSILVGLNWRLQFFCLRAGTVFMYWPL